MQFFRRKNQHAPPPQMADAGACAACGQRTSKRCSRCKTALFCSAACIAAAWKGHKARARERERSAARAAHSAQRRDDGDAAGA
jgi:hypothetical protein